MIKYIADELGVTKALGNSKQAKLALIQIAGRIIAQQSRNYIANQWSKTQDIEGGVKLINLMKMTCILIRTS